MSHKFDYRERIRSPQIAPLLHTQYTLAQLDALGASLAPALQISLNPLGRVGACSRIGEGEDPTHYDAVWVRDSVWAYWGLELTHPPDAARALAGLLEYFGIAAQRRRLAEVIDDPSLVHAPDGPMRVPHIRFAALSKDFDDVQVGGADQRWNHKQNDALALFAIAVGNALRQGRCTPDQIPRDSWEFLLRLPRYWQAVEVYRMEDAGAWEEIERLNSSSIGLVTHSLEIWQQLVSQNRWRELFTQRAVELGLALSHEPLFNGALGTLIAKGYQTLDRQLPHESPAYPTQSAKYREADAALLNLIFPCSLQALSLTQKRSVMANVETLVRPLGVLRYVGDAYQSAGYWAGSGGSSHEARTDDHSSDSAFSSRAGRFIPGTEAQWFFDSWVSVCHGLFYQESNSPSDLQNQIQYFNRALCQLTGPHEMGADGAGVPPFSLPESYNTVLAEDGSKTLVPSPITPLNWSKACLILALDCLKRSLR